MGRECDVWREQKCIKGSERETFKRERGGGGAGGESPLCRHDGRWQDSIKMDLKEIWRDGRDCIHLDQDRNNWWALVNMAMNLRVSGSVGSQSVTLEVTNSMKIITTGPIIHTSNSSVPSTVQRKLLVQTTQHNTTQHLEHIVITHMIHDSHMISKNQHANRWSLETWTTTNIVARCPTFHNLIFTWTAHNGTLCSPEEVKHILYSQDGNNMVHNIT